MSSGHTIMQRRKRTGLTQEKLAEQINVSRQTIAMWETSKQFPSDNVAIIAARFLDIPEEELHKQLRWDRLHQRVDQLEEQYNATITVKPAKEGQQMEDLSENATQSIDGVTITVIQICKSIYPYDPANPPLSDLLGTIDGRSPGASIRVGGPQRFQLYHTGEKLIVRLAMENLDRNLAPRSLHIEDNLGNQFRSICSGSTKGETVIVFRYAPEATSFTLRYDFVRRNEDECDVLLFEDVPVGGEGIAKTLGDDIITYNGIHWHKRKDGADSCWIHLLHNMAREVRHIGPAEITDNFGNQYGSPAGSGASHDEEKGIFHEEFNVKPPIDPNATSISFKYLFAREIITLELRDLPLPS